MNKTPQGVLLQENNQQQSGVMKQSYRYHPEVFYFSYATARLYMCL